MIGANSGGSTGTAAEETARSRRTPRQDGDHVQDVVAPVHSGWRLFPSHDQPSRFHGPRTIQRHSRERAAFRPIPFFFLTGFTAVLVAFGVSIVAHFAVGAAKSLLTTRNWLASGLEMTGVGILEAAVTYGLGLLFAVA